MAAGKIDYPLIESHIAKAQTALDTDPMLSVAHSLIAIAAALSAQQLMEEHLATLSAQHSGDE